METSITVVSKNPVSLSGIRYVCMAGTITSNQNLLDEHLTHSHESQAMLSHSTLDQLHANQTKLSLNKLVGH